MCGADMFLMDYIGTEYMHYVGTQALSLSVEWRGREKINNNEGGGFF